MKNGNVNKFKIAKMESQMKYAEFSIFFLSHVFVEIHLIFVHKLSEKYYGFVL
jgi:hypothetical protein